MAPSRGLQMPFASGSSLSICARCWGRRFSTASLLLSGHNRWSKIKHDKGKNDMAKHRQRQIFAQEITTASKLFGPEPSNNPRLTDLITKAKKEGFAKASIEAAIARGQGRSLSGASLEPVTVEGILPNNVAVIVESETDNKLRTLTEVRATFKMYGGNATPTSYLFEKQGRIVFERKDGISADDALEAALEAGATDVIDADDGTVIVSTEPGDTSAVGQAISQALGLQITTSEITWEPNEETQVEIPSEDFARQLAQFVDNLSERESTVQAVAMNVSQGSVNDQIWSELQDRIGG